MNVFGRILCWADSHNYRIISVSEPMVMTSPWQTTGRPVTLVVGKCSRCGLLTTNRMEGHWTAEQLGVRVVRGAEGEAG